MFQFSGFASHLAVDSRPSVGRVAPFGHLRINSICNPRSFSQLITSFFASESLGIPHTLLFTSLLYDLSSDTFASISDFHPLACLLFTLQHANLFAYLLFLCVNKFTHLLFYQYVNELFVSTSHASYSGTARSLWKHNI
jgi:hypothetical protein